MQYYRCKCGQRESYGSMAPFPCQGCESCGTTLETSVSDHRAPQEHKWVGEKVDTDEGPKWLTRCAWCGVKRPQPTGWDSELGRPRTRHMSDEEFEELERGLDRSEPDTKEPQ